MTYAINRKEVNYMPRMNGNGPMGGGQMSRRSLGSCAGANAIKYGPGLRMRSGLRTGLNQASPITQKELLQEQKNRLQERLEAIDRQLENL